MLTAEQIEVRRTRIGASEIGAVLGIDTHCTPLQLVMRKKMPRVDHAEDHRSWGNDVEPAILRNYTRRQGYALLPSPGTLVHPTLPYLCATPDGLGQPSGDRHVRCRDIQAKNVEEHHLRDWGEPGTADAPLLYVAQVTVEVGILLARAEMDLRPVQDLGDLAVSFGGRPPLGYPIPFNAELFGNLAEAAAKFVRDYLLTDKTPPLEGDRAALEYVKRRYRASDRRAAPADAGGAELAVPAARAQGEAVDPRGRDRAGAGAALRADRRRLRHRGPVHLGRGEGAAQARHRLAPRRRDARSRFGLDRTGCWRRSRSTRRASHQGVLPPAAAGERKEDHVSNEKAALATREAEVLDENESLPVPTDSIGMTGIAARAEIDVQIATAKPVPAQRQGVARLRAQLATLDVETAEQCFYVLPRGKTVEGPSVRLAEILASAWGNLRYGAEILGADETS
jgi:predicted phage-related endonuclease